MRRILAALYGAVAYLAFLLPVAYLAGFLTDVWVPKSINRGAGPLGPALWVDLGLLVLFGVQHSAMARPGYKRAVERWVPRSMERSMYTLVSGLTLATVYWLWRPIPAVLWDVSGTALGALARAGFALGWVLAVWATFAISHFYLFGVAQVAAYVRGREHPRMVLRSTVLYRIVRHPMTAGLLLAFWCTPRMTVGHLVFAAGMTAYSLVATVLEERDLLRSFGGSYRSYRREVPALVPVLRPGMIMPRRAGLWAELGVVAVGLGLAAAVPLHGAGAPRTAVPIAALETGGMEVDDRARTFALYDPASDPPAPGPENADPSASYFDDVDARARRPLVLALHGTAGSADRLRTFLGGALEQEARARGWLVAYPEALGGRWNDCRAASPRAGGAGIDDLAFLRALVDRLARDRGADPDRVFLLGYSGGGHMAFRVALEAGTLARGIAVFAASLPAEDAMACEDRTWPVPALIVNGDRDLINPHDGGDVIAPSGLALGAVRSVEATARYFRERAPGTPVRLVTVADGGHTVPGPRSRFPRAAGRVDRSFDGIREAMEFFADQDAARPPRSGASGPTAEEER